MSFIKLGSWLTLLLTQHKNHLILAQQLFYQDVCFSKLLFPLTKFIFVISICATTWSMEWGASPLPFLPWGHCTDFFHITGHIGCIHTRCFSQRLVCEYIIKLWRRPKKDSLVRLKTEVSVWFWRCSIANVNAKRTGHRSQDQEAGCTAVHSG